MDDKEKIHEEDVAILDFILNKLLEKSNISLENFTVSRSDDYDDFQWDDDDRRKKHEPGFFIASCREYSINWRDTDNRCYTNIKFSPAEGTVSISIGASSREFIVGCGSNNKDIKIKMMKLYHKAKEYQDIEIPRKEREEFINETTKVFPDMFDNMILGGEDGSEEEAPAEADANDGEEDTDKTEEGDDTKSEQLYTATVKKQKH